LKSAPTAHVIGKDYIEIGPTILNNIDQFLQRISAINPEPALPGVSERSYNPHLTTLCVLADNPLLVLRGVLLVVC
jgi:hypothetical protein